MLVIDFETVDPFITWGYGSGWVFSANYGNTEFKILGASIKIDNEDTYYETDHEKIKDIVLGNKFMVMHNAAYDMGCIVALFGGVFDWTDYMIYDTMVMGKLHTQNLLSYSLSSLGEKFNLPVVKNSALLWDYAWDTGLYQQWVKDTRDINKSTRPSDNVMDQFCKTHMDLFPVELVGQYANYDVDTTYHLYNYLAKQLMYINLSTYSDLLKITIGMKQRGIYLDIQAAKKASHKLEDLVKEKTKELYQLCNIEFNLNSVKQIVLAFENIGISGFPVTDKGNKSIGDGWLAEQTHPACVLLSAIRKTKKIKESFIDKLIEYQGMTGCEDKDIGIIYPSFHVLGATKTGRFTSGAYKAGSKEVNMQQIPARDPVLGPLCRSIFIAPAGEKWITADYSNQEQRLQVHFAAKWKLEGADLVCAEWNKDPHMDYHSKVAEMVGFLCDTACGDCTKCGQGRKYAKTINLGLSYGMGSGKLCTQLGLPTAWWKAPSGLNVEVAGEEGKLVLQQYHTMFPFMKKLQDTAASELIRRKYIQTIGGRYLESEFTYIDPKGRKGLSKLVQGSAADQIMKALINCQKAGLTLRATIHDEICITSCNPDTDVLLLEEAMTNTYPTLVPMVAEIGVGDNWGDSK